MIGVVLMFFWYNRTKDGGDYLKVNWLKFIGILVVDICIIGLVKEILFSDDINVLTFMWESISYNFTHFSFVGLFGMVGMLLLAIMFVFIPVCFLIINWEQLKSCFQKNNR